MQPKIKKCITCGNAFIAKREKVTYCSNSCRTAHYRWRKDNPNVTSSVNIDSVRVTNSVNKFTQNAIYNVDCLEGIKHVETGTVKTIVADPPYFLGMTHNGSKGSFVDLAICKPFYEKLFAEYKRVLNETGELYFFTDWRGFAFYYPLLDGFLNVRNMIVWDKISGVGNHYAFTHELIIYATVQGFAPNKKGTNVWREKAFTSGSQVTNGKKVHPTQKPIELIEKIILESTQEQDLVIDTFCGSGTTAIAARKHNRNFIGFELDESNFLIAKSRLENIALTPQFKNIAV